MPQNTDQQVLHTFQQEVRAALPELRRHLGRLAENPKRRDALQKAHRLVQGLSGAASLLGLANWSEMGSAVGHFLDEVVSGSQAMTAEAAQELQSTLELLEAELSASDVPEFPRFEIEEMEEDAMSLDAPPPDFLDETSEDCRFELVDVEEPAILQVPTPHAIRKEDLPLDEAPDSELMEVFQEEAEEHLGVIASSLRDLSADSNDADALQNVRRSMHTVKGAAGMVGLRTVQRIAHRSEDLLDRLSESDTKPDPAIVPLLQATADLIQDITGSRGADEAMRGAVIELCAQYDLTAAGAAAAPPEEAQVPEPSLLEEDAPVGGELLEVFQEEAAEHLGMLAANLRTLQTEPGDREVLQEIRRSMHTIKGAAGMVGLRSAQRVAHGSEDLLDRLYESETNPTAEVLNLIQRTADVIQDISEAGCANEKTRAAVLHLDAEYAALLNGAQLEAADAPPDPGEMELLADEPAATEEETGPRAGDDLGEDQAADGELLEVFQEEAAEHLGLIAQNLRALRETPNAPEVLQEVRRSMHTIKGAAGMVGLRSAQRVAHRSEDLLDVLYESGATLESAVLDLIQDSADLIQTVTEARGADAAGRERALELSARYDAFLQAVQLDDLAPEEPTFDAAGSDEAPAPLIEALAPAAAPIAAVAMPQASNMLAAAKSPSGQYARVPLERVEELVRLVSELIVSRSNFEQHCRRFTRESGELKLSGERITQLTAKLEADYAVKAMAEGGGSVGSPLAYAGGASAGSFDSLEFDRYSEFHLLSRDLNEAAADISSAGAQLHGVAGEFQNSLVRLSRLTGEVQDGLMRLRMAPIASLENRLHRTVRVAAQACNKKVRLEVVGGEVELDKSVLEEITGPLEHLLRNAVDHGVESPEKRVAAGKPEEGVVTLRAYLEGARAAIEVRDDGGGLDVDALRAKAVERGIHSQRAAVQLTQDETYELIFHAGFSTAAKVSEVSGRGVGMDVVRAAIESLNGSIGIHSEKGIGSAFSIGLPTSLAVARALMVQANSQVFAAPMHSVRQVIKLNPKDIGNSPQGEYVEFEGKRYKAVRLADALNLPGEADPENDRLAAMLIDAGKRSFVLLADSILEAAEVVVKNMGGLLRRVHGISAATIAGDGSVVLILNPGQLVDPPPAEYRRDQMEARDEINDQQLKVLVVDDSLSVRRVVTRLLESNDWVTVAARDGIEALEALKEMPALPDAILCDVEMPRMDGYELVSNLKSGVFAQIPVLMLTSRAGKKHRDRAKEIGVDDYLIKPFQDEALLTAIRGAVDAARRL